MLWNMSACIFTFTQSLAKFIRRRDPRYKSYLARQDQVETKLSRPDQPSRKPRTIDVYIEQDWQRVDSAKLDDDLEWATTENNDLEEWECVVCSKTFKTEAAWNSHERSKKHIKQVESLRRDMQEDELLAVQGSDLNI